MKIWKLWENWQNDSFNYRGNYRASQKLIERTGGSHGLRDRNLLESAVYSAQAIFDNEEAYPTLEEKAARLCYSITNNHAFIDGNKRISAFLQC